MSIKSLKSELQRLAQKIGAADESVVLIVLAVVRATTADLKSESDFPTTAGHQVDYRIQGQNVALFFPFAEMDSDQGEQMAKAIILHARQIERQSRYSAQVGVLDMRFAPSPDAWFVTWPPDGVTVEKHAADQYRQIVEARNEVS
ncbi:hypothetical protein [Pseudomonas coronafaciens]|uniref:hypothetical protein n=1 Tax=Pseudomonas coronafaciens TaxID=53409 RepID=UPI000EFF5006|nr:hypothetical protein [Pseudomonas coronafaciens]RMP33888.1 hypothetical protein ALQ25_03744 [Pseudomonas coronafaciens pv. atropurpurea]